MADLGKTMSLYLGEKFLLARLHRFLTTGTLDANILPAHVSRHDLPSSPLGSFEPALTSGNGRRGFPEHAPYDRIIATCSVTATPRAWLEQTHLDGMILTDVTSGIEGGLVRLTIGEDLRAEGRLTAATGRFMASRQDGHESLVYSGPDTLVIPAAGRPG